ncbi:GspE/PulE family protein [Rhodoferax ferrireducens]|uniref:GspE/PulE family protein n=1 Tax=Rhodoferax ferrireducens TaxID=192843 RepID=UPI000E0DFA06|nr:GspE/PulE family protein [Rhodoferax ferrireducens]
MNELGVLLLEARIAPFTSLATSLVDLKMADVESLAKLHLKASDGNRAAELTLRESGLVTELELEHARSHMLSTPEVDALAFQVEPEALDRLPWSVAFKHHVLPLGLDHGVLYAASPTPLKRELELQLNVIADCIVSLVWAPKAQIDRRLALESHAQAPQNGGPDNARDTHTDTSEHPQLDVHALLTEALIEMKSAGDQEQVNAVNESSSVIKLVNQMIIDAYEQKASDIHIETNAGDDISRVRFRKDGDLEDYLLLPFSLRAAVVSRIKIMSRLDISERRRPQDGKINFNEFSDIKLELRVAILPTHDNLEDVVMRLLASSKPIPLQQLGFSVRDDRIIKRLSERPFGLILACGPTGSGKTTTLHSLLAHINTDNRKIWTAEDPIEITQKGLRQLQVNPKIGVTFATAMRAFLRADPDVIMIGEVRDEETARVCIEASLTGHLVLSTLHTNSAAESVIRLLDLGMDPLNFGDSLIGIVAQRLVRSLCKHCAMSKVLLRGEYESLVHEYIGGTALTPEEGHKRLLAAAPSTSGAPSASQVSTCHAVGCEHCGGRGYKGRTGIYEVLENVGDMKHKIQARAPTSEIFAEASRAGMRTLRQDALEKVVAGLIDLKQARSVYA